VIVLDPGTITMIQGVGFLNFEIRFVSSCYTLLLMFGNTFMVIIKIIALIGTWRATQENSATTILHSSGLD
jgi:hypothetical protein